MKEGVVPFNAAARAVLPKAERKQVNYFQPEQLAAIREALEAEPIKWKTIVQIYAHVMEEAGKQNADILADVFLKRA